ncbi:MAG: adenosine kinase [Pseudomonadota bacterium]|nr:adenosine kinase [Pseudomonadota bacterium]
MKKILVCGIGNALVDSEYRVSEEEITQLNLTKGCMELNDEQNHIKLSSRLRETHGTVKMMPGGSVANSLYTLSQFGTGVSFIGRVSDDSTGDAFINSLKNTGVQVNINQVDNGITGECLVLITPDHERTMYTHLGVSSELDLNDINQAVIKDSEYLLVEGYLVTSEETKNVANYSLDIATKHGVKKIITLSDPNVVKFFRDNVLELLNKSFDIIFCNKQEALNISMTDNINDAMDFLKKYAHEIIVTCGEDGAYVTVGSEKVHELPDKVKPVDLTGAGDMFLAAYLFAKVCDRSLADRIKFANKCSGNIIQRYGAKLDDQDYSKLLEKL